MTLWTKHMEWMSKKFKTALSIVPKWKSSCTMMIKIYFKGLISFLRDVDKGTFKKGNSIERIYSNSPHVEILSI
jgi:hypothetical protein